MCNKTKSLSIKLKKDCKTKEHCLVFQFLFSESLENPVDTSQKVLLLPYILNFQLFLFQHYLILYCMENCMEFFLTALKSKKLNRIDITW